MNWFISTFQMYPELSIFLTVALGFFIGKLKYKSFSLGNVTSVLLVGVLVGQMKITISPTVKNVFFLLFLFAVGYSVGPQFFNSLKKTGIPQLIFATLMSVFGLLSTFLLAKIMGYNAGQAAGLFAGSQTISAVIGVGGNTISGMSMDETVKESIINAIPICYAVTYLFGTIGSAIILAQIGPMFWGGVNKARAICEDLEKKMGLGTDDVPDMISTYSPIVFRAYNISPASVAVGKTVNELEEYFSGKGYKIFVERVREKSDRKIFVPQADYKFSVEDDIVLQGKGEMVITEMKEIGKELFDRDLLNFKVSHTKVMLINKDFIGKTIRELSHKKYKVKISLEKIMRGGTEIPLLPGTQLHRGDILSIIGHKDDVESSVKVLGYPDVDTQKTDIMSIGLGILLGGLLGVIAFHIGKANISLSTSGGVLISGLFFGWLRSKHPTIAKIPEPALWVMNTLGLNVFIAVVGISAAPGFITGLQQAGVSLFLIGAAATAIPLLMGLVMARFIFKFNPAEGLGCCCGSRTTTAGLPAVQDALKSKLPALGYTVTYAVGNTVLILCGIILIFLMN